MDRSAPFGPVLWAYSIRPYPAGRRGLQNAARFRESRMEGCHFSACFLGVPVVGAYRIRPPDVPAGDEQGNAACFPHSKNIRCPHVDRSAPFGSALWAYAIRPYPAGRRGLQNAARFRESRIKQVFAKTKKGHPRDGDALHRPTGRDVFDVYLFDGYNSLTIISRTGPRASTLRILPSASTKKQAGTPIIPYTLLAIPWNPSGQRNCVHDGFS